MWYPRLDRSRPGFRKRGYDSRWDRDAEEYRRRYPFRIGGLAVGRCGKADIVDHVVPHRGDRGLFRSVSNWQAVCHWHHNTVKAELERLFSRGEITAADLRLNSAKAMQLTRERYRPAVGLDGFACE